MIIRETFTNASAIKTMIWVSPSGEPCYRSSAVFKPDVTVYSTLWQSRA